MKWIIRGWALASLIAIVSVPIYVFRTQALDNSLGYRALNAALTGAGMAVLVVTTELIVEELITGVALVKRVSRYLVRDKEAAL